MLVLKRKAGESIIIDGGIKVTILKIEGQFIKIGIEAPNDINIVREEIAEKYQEKVNV